MSTAVLDLLQLAAEISEGSAVAGQLCPFCNGGSSKERTLSLKREGRYVLYICHRDSCGHRGKLNVATRAAKEIRQRKRSFVTNPSKLSDGDLSYLYYRYNLSDQEVSRLEPGWTTKYSPEGLGRVYLPCFRYDGTVRGYTVRDLTGSQSPKSLSFKYREDEPKLCWYYTSRKLPLIIVEDQFSAIRASSYCNSVALLGTHLSDDAIDEIRGVHHGKVFLALDKDATMTAVKTVVQNNSRLKMTVTALGRDLKDLTREELDSFFKDNMK